METEVGVVESQAKEPLKIREKMKEERARAKSFLELLKRAQFRQHLDCGCLAQNNGGIHFCCNTLPSLCSFVTAAPGK